MESKLMPMTSEPTTGEIVRALRTCNNPKGQRCSQCVVFSRYDNARDCKRTIDKLASDRLESQGREIERLIEELEQMEEAATVLHAANETHWTYIKELAARAESAERERDSAISDLKNAPRCSVCDHQDCKYCTGNDMFTWRGLQPQEGE